jgi:protein O-mannosyl-transferase
MVPSMSHVHRAWLTAIALACVTIALFLPALRCGFINYDDPDYVTDNSLVASGVTVAGFRQAFTTFRQANWHPLTWLSLQLDASLWKSSDGGFDPLGFHLTNVLLHGANAALFFLALRTLTGCFWRSVAVALLFAVHPQRVESVVWVSERKDVLSGFFGLLALLAYARYARKPSVGGYLATAIAFVLSLMAKPMLVTLPCLLLVLDWWPLRRWPELTPTSPAPPQRFGARESRKGAITKSPTKDVPLSADLLGRPAQTVARARLRLIAEKLPLFAIAAASCVVTYLAQSGEGVVRDLTKFPLQIRLENAAIAYVAYLGQMAWPVGLTLLYPHRGQGIPSTEAVEAAILLVAITVAVASLRKRAPYALAGWLWYVGTLVPVIGLVQVGIQSHADRYSYIPEMGLLVALCWGVADLGRSWPRAVLTAAAAVAAVLAVVTWNQIWYWKDSVALWSHDIEVTMDHPLALNHLGIALQAQNDVNGAEKCYSRAIKILPDYDQPLYNLARLMQKLGKQAEATELFERYCRLRSPGPQANLAHLELGIALFQQQNLPAARQHLAEAIRLDPGLVSAHYYLGLVEMSLGRYDSAVTCFEKSLNLYPNSADARAGLGITLLQVNRLEEAVAHLREAVRCDPENLQAHLWLGKALVVQNNLAAAAPELEEAVRISPNMALARYEFGQVRARQGRLKEAAESFARAVELEPRSEEFRKTLAASLDALGRAGQGEAARQIQERMSPLAGGPSGAASDAAAGPPTPADSR